MAKKRKEKAAAAPPPDADPVTRTIAVNGQIVVVATGRRWRAVDVGTRQQLHSNTSHEGAVRGVSLSPDGQQLLMCSDDKTARVWNTQDWSCSRIFKAPKKASACTFSADGKHLFFADRFGDVLVAETAAAAAAAAAEPGSSSGAGGGDNAAAPAVESAEVLLGHLQAIISSLTVTSSSSSGQQLIVSTDRDGKVRCSVLPDNPAKGSYEIQSYCLGHTAFVACSAAVPAAAGSSSSSNNHLLLTGSGDGTIRLWDVDTGKQLACYVASEAPRPEDAAAAAADAAEQQQDEQEQQQEEQAADNEDEDDGGNEDASGVEQSGASKQYQKAQRVVCSAVLSLAVAPDGCTVAATVEGQQEVLLLRLDPAAGSLQLVQKLRLQGVANPATVVFDGQGRLWVLGGLLLLVTESAHVGVAVKQGDEWADATAEVLPAELQAFLECRVEAEEAAAEQQQGSYYHEGLKRKVYSQEERQQREERKKQRRDEIETKRLAALQAAEAAAQQKKAAAAAGSAADGAA